jgi:hypothetical protein
MNGASPDWGPVETAPSFPRWCSLDCRDKEAVLARNNYKFEKRRRELAKKKKKEEKRQRKLAKENPEAAENSETAAEETPMSEPPAEPGTPRVEGEDGAAEVDPVT